MNTVNLSNRFSTVLILTAAVALSGTGTPVHADTFGSGVNTFSVEFVNIGSPGNAQDATGDPNPVGSVANAYRIGKYEISEQMIEKANALGGLDITQSLRGPDKPATYVSWNEATRFINWLNTSQGFPAAYKFAAQPGEVGYDATSIIELWASGDVGFNAANPFRNSQAHYFLPSHDEWYKAAYYDPTNGVYYDFPTGSDSLPTAVASGTAAGTSVIDQPLDDGPADVVLAGGLSPYGTIGQGGNVLEWQETEFDLLNDSSTGDRGVRGGQWYSGFNVVVATYRGYALPANSGEFTGFRVASVETVPEPSAAVLGAIACGLMWWGRKRRQ